MLLDKVDKYIKLPSKVKTKQMTDNEGQRKKERDKKIDKTLFKKNLLI